MVNSQLVPGQYDVIITVSGDGLVHEIVNGLLNRADWSKPVEVPGQGKLRFSDTVTLGAIPGGTGNGLIKSLLNRADENYGVMEAAFRIIKGNSVRMDLTEITFEYEPNKKVYSFLSLAWSIVADIDINSEVFRCCGPSRFTVWAAWRILFMRDYYGSLRYIGENCNASHVIKKRN